MAEGCYVSKYLPASFKGVPFVAIEASSEHGRRGATGEFPFGESTAYADLGRKIRTYSISGKFPGNDHIANASLLILACETPGPGLLVHPTRGILTVACTSCKVSDDIEEGMGVTNVDMEFVEANILGSGFQFGGLVSGLVMTGLALAVQSSFIARYNTRKTPFYQTSTVLASVTNGLEEVRSRFEKAISFTTDSANWTILRDMDTLIARPALFHNTVEAYGAIERSLAALARVTTGAAKLAAFKGLSNWAATRPAMRGVSGESIDAVYSSFRLLSAGYMARGYSEQSTLTIAESLGVMDSLDIILKEEAAIAYARCDNLLHLEISKFQTDVDTLILNRIYNQPALVSYNFGSPVSSLTAAYEIYGDSKRFLEIEAMNPGSLPFIVGPEVLATRS